MTEEEEKETIENNFKPITEICLSGACNRGISYIGCFKKLEELKLLKLEKIVGVSIGSFIAACYMIGYSSDDLLEMIIDKNMNEFKDFSINETGALLKGEQYKNWVYEVLSKKEDPNITLDKLFEKTNIEYTVTTTCIHSVGNEFSEGMVYLNHKHTPDMSLFTAVNCSMAFPFIFPPVNYKGYQFIDGGVLDNFPMDLLSLNAIGLKVNFKPIDSSTSTGNPISYIGKIFELISNRFKILKNEQHQNIIMINCDDFNIIDFGMSIDDKITLYKRGYNAMDIFLNQVEVDKTPTDIAAIE
jgi:predicted acylesterase/phospholipase RssA